MLPATDRKQASLDVHREHFEPFACSFKARDMLQPLKPRFHPLDWIATLSAERTTRSLRMLSATLYLLLSLLALMQISSAGALQRVAAQSTGETLLVALAGLLLLLGAIAIGSAATQSSQPIPHPGASDALLHFALAIAGLDLALPHSLLSGAIGSLVIGGLGLVLLGCGMVLLLSGALPNPGDATLRGRRLRAVKRRDQLVRGLVLAVLGGFLFEAAADGIPGTAVGLSRTPWGKPLLAATCVALLAYGLHALWLMREENHLWQM